MTTFRGNGGAFMSRVYLINVGANTSHSSIARSPIFNDAHFIFVPFPTKDKGLRPYSTEAMPFVRVTDIHYTHADPDWENLTYGDYCKNPRALALRNVAENDTLLFWALLWRNSGKTWDAFTGERCWCLIGALRVREILKDGQRPEDAKDSRVERARQNAHFYRSKLDTGDRVFIGCTRYSQFFSRAVDLEVTIDSGLLYKVVRTAKGDPLRLNGTPRWNSSLRACRVIWDLNDPESRARAEITANAIHRQTGYDLLSGL
jgi:hypothetical protein